MSTEHLNDIKAAIARLPAQQGNALKSWLMLGDHVAEAALDYGTPVEQRRLSVDEYLEFEKHCEGRHEYIDGAIYAMSGVSENHDVITLNLLAPHMGTCAVAPAGHIHPILNCG